MGVRAWEQPRQGPHSVSVRADSDRPVLSVAGAARLRALGLNGVLPRSGRHSDGFCLPVRLDHT